MSTSFLGGDAPSALDAIPDGSDARELLAAALEHAATYVGSLPDRPVGAALSASEVSERLPRELPDTPMDPRRVLDDLVADAESGLVAMNSARYFGLVVGGTLPVALAADWMASTWDQNAILASPSPSVAAIEDIAGAWLLHVFGLPATASFAFVTGCQMAHVTALAAARHRVLANVGWNVEQDGLGGAPRVRVIVGEERHVTVDRALRLLGFGVGCIESVGVDEHGALLIDDLVRRLEGADGPTIVCGQAGNVNTGAVDPLAEMCEAAHAAGAWMHVDGAFGLWANASPRHRGLLRGCERADSWATDAHMWLNVPYDCGVAIVADREAHRSAMAMRAPFFQHDDPVREPLSWTPESSRRARSLPVYAALRSLGRSGVRELVERLCACADRFADRLDSLPGIELRGHALNQVLVCATDGDDVTDRLVEEIQRDGTCWMSGSTWHGRRCVRISVCSWRTTFEDVDRSVETVASALARARDAKRPSRSPSS